jgi:hypothetical protein
MRGLTTSRESKSTGKITGRQHNRGCEVVHVRKRSTLCALGRAHQRAHRVDANAVSPVTSHDEAAFTRLFKSSADS